MSVAALISGTISRAPEQKTSRNGNPFVTASIRVVNGNEANFWRIFVFSESAQAALLALGEGDSVACQGTPKFEMYAPEGGAARVSLSLTVDQVVALKQPPKERPKKEKAKAATPSPANRQQPARGDGLNDHACAGASFGLDDAIPFAPEVR
jgi:single-stranded DNA-binding protein